MSTTSTVHTSPTKAATAVRWALQGIVAVVFLGAGAAKLAGVPAMVVIFEHIRIGQWFRYVTAVVEITGAILLVWPGRSGLGALLLACTMAAALFTHFTILGGNWGPAAVLFALNLLIMWLNRAQVEAAFGRSRV